MGDMNLKVVDNEYVSATNKLVSYCENIGTTIDRFNYCLSYLVSQEGFKDDTFPAKVAEFKSDMSNVNELNKSITSDVKKLCNTYVSEIDEKDQFLY